MTRFAGLTGLLATFAFGLVSAPALASSCGGTTGIGTALTEAEIVVVGRVERRLDPSEGLDSSGKNAISPVYPNPIVVKVLRTLKGDVSDEIRVTTDPMGFQSFNLDDMKPGETFVFPIYRTLESGVVVLPICSHSALKLVGSELYTNEFTDNGGRQLAHYVSLTTLRLLLPLGLLNPAVQIALVAAMLLLLPIPVTSRFRRPASGTAGAELLPHPVGSLRSVNLRAGLAIAWLLLCAGFSTFLGFVGSAPLGRVTGGGIGLAFAIAAMGMALRWRWTEGLGYGLALMCIVGGLALAYWGVGAFFESFARYGYTDPSGLFIVLLVMLLFIVIMMWYADTVRRRFSSTAS